MAQTPMYPSVNNSVPTELTGDIAAAETNIPVINGAVLPAGPNIATIDADDNAELVYYTAIEGNTLTGCVRGYNGTLAQVWSAGTLVYRAYTAADHAAFIRNIEDLALGKLAVDGDGSALTAAFVQAAARQLLASGDTLETAFGKIARWLSDLKTGAFAAIGTGAADVAAGRHAAQHASGGADPVTPAAINAVNKAGDTMTGSLLIGEEGNTEYRGATARRTVGGVAGTIAFGPGTASSKPTGFMELRHDGTIVNNLTLRDDATVSLLPIDVTGAANKTATLANLGARMAAGVANITFTGGAVASLAITFPVGRFTAPPRVALALYTVAPADKHASVSQLTATGCTLYVYIPTGSGTIGCHWHAIQDI